MSFRYSNIRKIGVTDLDYSTAKTFGCDSSATVTFTCITLVTLLFFSTSTSARTGGKVREEIEIEVCCGCF